ncbi:MAG: NUDIX domain-containing protein [Alphaproteobacteria bacterium]|nr:NUDIX domain-containing protein [Alphaproteobacteria bacterium]
MSDIPEHPDVRVLAQEVAFKRHLRLDVVRFRHRLFSGEWSGERVWDIVRRGASVAVVLYDPDRDAVVLVEQFRLAPLMTGFTPWVVEVVAGLVDHEGEADEDVARREAVEEAGLEVLGELIPIQRYTPTPGDSDQATMLFCGRVDSRGAGGVYGVADEDEDIRVVVKPLAEIESMVDAGAIDNGHSLICLYWLIRHRDELRRKWGAM